MELSTIITTYKEDKGLIEAHVRECMNSTKVPDEIIVVNDGWKDDIKNILFALPRNTKIIYAKILEDIPWNYTGARNLGFWLSRGDFISIEDVDHIPEKNFYELAIKELKENQGIDRVKTIKRWVVDKEDIINKPVDEWKVVVSRPPHEDCTVLRRELYQKIKGYDERFAGAYGWSATCLKRRLNKIDSKYSNIGYQYVMASEKTRGLSSRNYTLARRVEHHQAPGRCEYCKSDEDKKMFQKSVYDRCGGILNFQYDFEIWERNQ